MKPNHSDLSFNQATPTIVWKGLTNYPECLRSMKEKIDDNISQSKGNNEVWITEHHACYTLHAKKSKRHIKHPLPYPLYPTDRGGDITHHGPGQLILYFLCRLDSLNLNHKGLLEIIEQTIISYLRSKQIMAHTDPINRGVYIQKKKLASIGLRVKKQWCYHGCAINLTNPCTPFTYINPCGLESTDMTRLLDHWPDLNFDTTREQIANQIIQNLYASSSHPPVGVSQ